MVSTNPGSQYPGPLPTAADAVVVGGGVVGAFTALELAKRGLRPLLLEKGTIGCEQSSRNWGYIRQQGRDDPEIPLMVEAHGAWAAFEETHGRPIGWAERGNLRLVADSGDLDWYRDWAVKGNANGVPARLLDDGDLASVLPRAQGRWAGAMFTPNDGQAEPGLATQAVAAAAVDQGAVLRTGVTVDSILVSDGRVIGVATPAGVVSTPRVIVCGGIWTRRLLAPLGLNLPMQWVRLTVAETAPTTDFPDIPAVWSPAVAFRKTAHGTILFAASQRADVDATLSALNNVRTFLPTLSHNLRTFQVSINRAAWLDARTHLDSAQRYRHWDPRPNPKSVRLGYEALLRIYPELSAIPVARSWGGYIDGTPDNLPVLSTVPQLQGLTIGAGFSGHGFGLSPASGRVLADLAETGTSTSDIAAFDFARFALPSFRAARKVAH